VIDFYKVESDRETNKERVSPQRNKKANKSGSSTQLNATFDTQHDVGISGASREKRSNNRRRTKQTCDIFERCRVRQREKRGKSQPAKKGEGKERQQFDNSTKRSSRHPTPSKHFI